MRRSAKSSLLTLRLSRFKVTAELFKTQRFWRKTSSYCAVWTAAVALLTFLGFRLRLSFATASFCYLLLLLLQSLSGNFVSSAVVSLLTVGCLDYFFVDPLFSFQVNSPLDTLGLASFLITGLVITKLVAKLRAGTEASGRQQARLQRLYDLAQQLLALEPDAKATSHFLEPFRAVFSIGAVCFFDATNAEIYIAGDARDDLEKRTGEAFIHGKDR